MSDDKDSKTEDPTQKKLDESHKKGQVAASREISNFFILLVFTLILTTYAGVIMKDSRDLMLPFISKINDIPTDVEGLGNAFYRAMLGLLVILSLPFLGAVIAAIASRVIQTGFLISIDPIQPKLERISPKKGLERMFSMRSIIEFLKGIVKIIIVGVVAFFSVYADVDAIQQLPVYTPETMLEFLQTVASHLLIGVLIAVGLIALLDFIYQKYEHIKSLRMSKQEIKDEYKQQEGDPQVKQRLRQIRMERAQQRMMQEVPKSDVVITNPTHYAVALKYDMGNMAAPKVVAKGKDYIALKIRDVAKEHDIPVIQNPPLARSLHEVHIDDEIPIELYQGVAEIISYVFKLKGKDAPMNTPSTVRRKGK